MGKPGVSTERKAPDQALLPTLYMTNPLVLMTEAIFRSEIHEAHFIKPFICVLFLAELTSAAELLLEKHARLIARTGKTAKWMASKNSE